MNDPLRAIIDLGSNTFHILIAQVGLEIKLIEKKRFYVHLGEGGLGVIKDSAVERALSALAEIKEILDRYAISSLRCFGTAALRSAENGADFVETVRNKFNLKIEIIDGLEEAHLIYTGVSALNPFTEGHGLIMDIGGGSVEFILADEERVLWSKSYNLGILELHTKFHKSDPLDDYLIQEMYSSIRTSLSELATELKKYHAIQLIGASGTFDVLKDATGQDNLLTEVPLTLVDQLFSEVRYLNREERARHEWIPKERSEFMVEALVLIRCVFEMRTFSRLLVSSYALKEGALLIQHDRI